MNKIDKIERMKNLGYEIVYLGKHIKAKRTNGVKIEIYVGSVNAVFNKMFNYNKNIKNEKH